MKTVKLYDANKLADELGLLRAEIKSLQEVASGMESYIKSGGDGATEGTLFRAMVSTADRTSVNWKRIATYLKPSRQLITANSTTKSVTTLKLSAHPKL